jgi:hypothetical protein
VTDVFNVVQGGKRTLHVNIPTYSDSKGQVSGSAGSWKVTARLDVTPGAAPANVLAVVPLFYGSIDSKFVPADIPFTLPAGTTRARLDYRVTGHGGALDMNMNPPPGCGGPAEEFCQRAHHVYADDALVKTLTPWRMDCSNLCNLVSGAPWGKYCDKDPCGLPASVDAPRANWCPGSLTPPISFTPAQLAAPGMHTVKFVVDGIYPGGQWRVSAEVYAYGG